MTFKEYFSKNLSANKYTKEDFSNLALNLTDDIEVIDNASIFFEFARKQS